MLIRACRCFPLALAGLGLLALAACDLSRPPKGRFNRGGEIDAIKELLRPPAMDKWRDGVAAAVLVDTSGSMESSVRDLQGGTKPKIEIARAAVASLIRQFSDFAAKHPELPVLVGVYEFSTRQGQPSCRNLIKLGKPDVAAAEQHLRQMVPEGSTPIGDAMIVAKQDLDASGLSRRHILVVTDGESNRGFTPGDVTGVISGRPEAERAAVYFIAFDVEAELFDPVKNAGGLVLAASSEPDLRQTLDYILTGKILVEQPSK